MWLVNIRSGTGTHGLVLKVTAGTTVAMYASRWLYVYQAFQTISVSVNEEPASSSGLSPSCVIDRAGIIGTVAI